MRRDILINYQNYPLCYVRDYFREHACEFRDGLEPVTHRTLIYYYTIAHIPYCVLCKRNVYDLFRWNVHAIWWFGRQAEAINVMRVHIRTPKTPGRFMNERNETERKTTKLHTLLIICFVYFLSIFLHTDRLLISLSWRECV